MNLVRSFVAAVSLVALSACAEAAPPKPIWKMTAQYQNEAATKPVTVRHDGVTVLLEPTTRKVVYEQGEEPEDEPVLKMTVTFPGQPPFLVPADENRNDRQGIGVGIGRLAKDDATASVILGGYAGGMHCCMTTQVITLIDGKPRVITLPMIDGGPQEKFPQDVDGDGVIDFVIPDDRFLYAFTSYNASYAPLHFWNIRNGELVDVSREPRMAAAILKDAAETRVACESTGDEQSNGGCAAYAASMALLGKGEEGIAFAVAHAKPSDWLPEPCTVPMVNEECPEGKSRTFKGFEEALRYMLADLGYTPKPA